MAIPPVTFIIDSASVSSGKVISTLLVSKEVSESMFDEMSEFESIELSIGCSVLILFLPQPVRPVRTRDDAIRRQVIFLKIFALTNFMIHLHYIDKCDSI